MHRGEKEREGDRKREIDEKGRKREKLKGAQRV